MMQFFTPGISLYGSMPIHSSPACSPIAATLRQTRESCVSSKRVVYGEISVKKQTNKIVYELQGEVHLTTPKAHAREYCRSVCDNSPSMRGPRTLRCSRGGRRRRDGGCCSGSGTDG